MKPERMQRTSIFLSEKTIKEAKENGIIMSVICRKAIDKAIERVKNANE
jgi:predicted ABC-type ATPase